MKYKGKKVTHGFEGCALGASTLCRMCHQRGHLSIDCSMRQNERPTCLEELIPSDIKMRYGIISHTPIEFLSPIHTSREFAEINEIEIPDTYKELGECLEKYKITVDKVTKDSREDRIKAIKSWGVNHGYRIVMIASVGPTNND